MDLELSTSDRTAVIDITSDVETAVPDELAAGLCLVFVPHTTAGVIVNEAEPRLRSDIGAALARLVPFDGEYAHDDIDDNAAAHLRTSILGESVVVPVVRGALALGTWQSVLFVECDGPRTRTVRVETVTG